MTTTFEVRDASCGHCKSTIESAVTTLDDVSRAELDLESKRLAVEHAPTMDIERLKQTIEDAGYTPELVG